MSYVIATSRPWCEDIAEHLTSATGRKFVLVRDKRDLVLDRLSIEKPRYVFFPHWSYRIPPDIYANFECVIFHMTDVPFGRGGSPLQNLIARGIYETKISALRCVEEIDAGPVYMKRPFSLHGTAEEIYLRAADVITGMIAEIVEKEPSPLPQEGKAVVFARRRPEEGDLSRLTDLRQIFDYIRMLDAVGYPNAFLESDHFRFEFQRPVLKAGKIIADVVITNKGKIS